ncbi:MAG: SDR family NAD(P)-dependent oxidoreductase [Caulobacterales bacterium]
MKLQGKRAIITGSSAGIGRSIALFMAKEGAKIVVNARGAAAIDNVVEEIRSAGGTAIGFAGAVDDENVADALVSCCVKGFGGVDIVINNAAIFGLESIGPVHNCPPDIWRQTFDVNIHGAFYLSRAAIGPMTEQGWGRIINASSYAGTGKLGGSAYPVSKAALIGLTRSMAADYGPYGVTVNAYNPEALTAMGDGGTNFDAYVGMLKHWENRGMRKPEDTAYSMETSGPEAIAPWVAYLCTDEADNINGQVFAVEGRRIALVSTLEEDRILFRDYKQYGPWSLDELSRMAPVAFRLTNAWPRRTGEDLERWKNS